MKQLFFKIANWFGLSDEFNSIFEKTQTPPEFSNPIKTHRIYGEIGDMPNFNFKQNLHSKYNKGVGVYRDKNGRFTSIKTNKK